MAHHSFRGYLALVPQYYWDAIYKDIPGLKKVVDGVYEFPCDTKLNVTMYFK